MACTSYCLDQHVEEFDGVNNHDQEEREEEALSLCDLPICHITKCNVDNEQIQEASQPKQDEFDFGSLIGSINALESEMCSADEVFSGGQILPFRHSVSSESGLSRSQNSSLRSVSRSESMDRRGLGSRSSSTRSSSIRSQYSTTSTSSNNTVTSVKTIPIPKTKVRNNFHSHPSPKPQVWASGARSTTYTTPMGKKSTMWDVLRLGLVRTPELELHRTSTSSKTFIMPRTNSTGSNNSGNNDIGATKSCSTGANNSIDGPTAGNKIGNWLQELQKRKNQVNRPQSQSSGGFFKSCKCSVMAIEPIPTRDFGSKSGYFDAKIANSGPYRSSPNCQVSNEDQDLAKKIGLQRLQEQQQQKKNKKIRQGKKGMSHRRTFEWLRDLSHANVLNS